jgi:hypothetical protein
METEQIVVDRAEARALFRKYRLHQHYSKPIDREIQRTYQLIAQGRVVIRALESMKAAGVNDDGLPKLAICRADAAECYYEWRSDGGARFAKDRWVKENHRRSYIDFPAGSFPQPVARGRQWARAVAIAPLIPIDLRPKRGLENYHVLWEAVWQPAPPVDPMLLRRIGEADLWVVVAAWELSEVERAALAARIPVR